MSYSIDRLILFCFADLRSSSNKTKGEEEVDHLTDLLVKSMENANEPDFFGKLFNNCDDDRSIGGGVEEIWKAKRWSIMVWLNVIRDILWLFSEIRRRERKETRQEKEDEHNYTR